MLVCIGLGTSPSPSGGAMRAEQRELSKESRMTRELSKQPGLGAGIPGSGTAVC